MFDKRLEKFRDIHKGKRAFITACGPSLNDIPIKKLENELVYGVSLAYKKEGLKIDYHFMGDMNIAKQFHEEISRIISSKHIWFVSDSIYRHFFNKNPNVYFFTGHGYKCFYTDITKRIYGGGTSTFLAMQFAYYMGCQELYVVGLDHYKSYGERRLKVKNTATKNPSGEYLVMSTGEDDHHFSPSYYGSGVKFYKPTVWKMEESYRMARNAFKKDGREIYNASTETALSEDVLPRIDIEKVL